MICKGILHSLRVDREGCAKITFEISQAEAHKVSQIPTEKLLDLKVEESQEG